jgi:hypothetical protein
MAEESMHKKYNATQKNIHLLKEISFLKSQKKVSLDKMNHVQNLSYAKDLIFIMGQLFLKGEISFYIDSSLYLSKTNFSRIVANLDLSILFQLLPDPESLIEHILNDYSKFDEDYNLQAISAHLIDKYHEMNARSEQLLKHA